MKNKNGTDYGRIESAIHFIRENMKSQPSLEQIAGHVNMSSLHFLSTFQEWAGVSPKQFRQYLNAEYAKHILKKTDAYLSETASETGLSGTGRQNDPFVSIEAMTTDEYRNGGENLSINYSFAESPFGEIFIASTRKGICCLEFTSDRKESVKALSAKFPNAKYNNKEDDFQRNALSVFTRKRTRPEEIKLHLKGTEFQLRVWNALLHIPAGGMASYSGIAAKIKNDRASRAVGTAIGGNPVAFIIPCHRVIRSDGDFGNYRWGTDRKAAILGWEASVISMIH